MNQQVLINALKHPDAKYRLQAVQVIHMVEETAAVLELIDRYRQETDPVVKEALLAAGRHVRERKEAGYDTLDAIFEYFKINEELKSMDSEDEARLIKEIQERAHLDMIKERRDNTGKQMLTNAGALLGGALLGGVSGATLVASTILNSSSSDVLSSNITAAHERKERTPPTALCDTDCRVQVRRLIEDPAAARRRGAAIDLGNLNNPAALPFLALAFLKEADADVRRTAQRAGKQIYWNGIYSEISRSGILEKEMARRKKLLNRGETLPDGGASAPAPEPQATDSGEQPSVRTTEQLAAATSQDEIDSILRRAQESRAKRERGK